MSIRLKLVSCISAFILVLGIFIFGVLSAEQATVNLGGSISFEATDVYARVTGQVQHAQSNPTLQPLEFSADNDTPDQSSWSGLQLQFDSRATNITIEVTVENLSMERTLTVNLTDMIQTSTDNLGKSITLDNGAYVSGTNTTVPVATSNDENNTSKVTFLITFDVIDHNLSLPSTDFDYDINLYDESGIPEVYQPFAFEVIESTTNEVRITEHYGSGDVVIPATFTVDETNGNIIEGTDYVVTEIADGKYNGKLNGDRVDYYGVFDESVTSIYFPSTIKRIGAVIATNGQSGTSGIVFNSNTLERVIFEDNSQLETIDDYAFFCESGLVSIDFGENSQLASIGENAFYRCGLITSITIPENVTSIGAYAFLDCSSLTSITIDSSYAYQNADGGLSWKDNYLLQDANTVRVNVALVGEPGNLGFEANEYLNANFSYNTTPVNGYYIFTRNQ